MKSVSPPPERRTHAFLAAALLPLFPLVSGCTRAPVLSVAGAYFPAWLACALVGVAAAVVARIGFVAAGVARAVPLQLFVCASLGVMAAALVWLAWIGL